MEPGEISDKRRSMMFINILISCIASAMLATALTTALPSIISDFGITATTAQWLTSGYSLVTAIAMPITPFLLRRFRTKRLYVTAILIFIVGLLLSAVSFNFPTMMVGRVFQATGGGMLSAMAQIIILTMFPRGKQGAAMGWYGLSLGAAPVIAPTLSGILVDTLGWKWIFIFASLIMLVSLIWAFACFDNVMENEKVKFDILSFFLCALAFGGFTLGIGNIGNFSFTNMAVLIPLAFGLFAGILFVYRQLRSDSPFLSVLPFKQRQYTLSVIASVLVYFIVMGASTILPLYVQQVLGRAATISALVTLPGSLVMAVISPFTGRLYDRFGMRVLFIFGSVCVTISGIAMLFVTVDTPLWVTSLINVVRNLSTGCLMMPLVTWGVSSVDKSLTSHASAFLNSLRNIGGAIGSAIFVAIMSAVAVRTNTGNASAAQMRGVNMAFAGMAIIGLILLLMALFGTKSEKGKQKQ